MLKIGDRVKIVKLEDNLDCFVSGFGENFREKLLGCYGEIVSIFEGGMSEDQQPFLVKLDIRDRNNDGRYYFSREEIEKEGKK